MRTSTLGIKALPPRHGGGAPAKTSKGSAELQAAVCRNSWDSSSGQLGIPRVEARERWLPAHRGLEVYTFSPSHQRGSEHVKPTQLLLIMLRTTYLRDLECRMCVE